MASTTSESTNTALRYLFASSKKSFRTMGNSLCRLSFKTLRKPTV